MRDVIGVVAIPLAEQRFERIEVGRNILRTSLASETLAEEDVVRAYKNLEQAERAFGSFKAPTCRSARSITTSKTVSARMS